MDQYKLLNAMQANLIMIEDNASNLKPSLKNILIRELKALAAKLEDSDPPANNYDYLVSKCAGTICKNSDCQNSIQVNPANERFYITMGHAGFNSDQNNTDGYGSRSAAKLAIKYFSKPR